MSPIWQLFFRRMTTRGSPGSTSRRVVAFGSEHKSVNFDHCDYIHSGPPRPKNYSSRSLPGRILPMTVAGRMRAVPVLLSTRTSGVTGCEHDGKITAGRSGDGYWIKLRLRSRARCAVARGRG